MHFLIIKKTPFILTKGDWFAVPPLLYRRNSSIHLILFFNGNDSGTAYCDFSNPAPKLPSASLFSSASQPMGISLCQNDLCILLFFNAFNWFINHETTKYHSHRSPVCQGFQGIFRKPYETASKGALESWVIFYCCCAAYLCEIMQTRWWLRQCIISQAMLAPITKITPCFLETLLMLLYCDIHYCIGNLLFFSRYIMQSLLLLSVIQLLYSSASLSSPS